MTVYRDASPGWAIGRAIHAAARIPLCTGRPGPCLACARVGQARARSSSRWVREALAGFEHTSSCVGPGRPTATIDCGRMIEATIGIRYATLHDSGAITFSAQPPAPPSRWRRFLAWLGVAS